MFRLFCEESELDVLENHQRQFDRAVVEKCLQAIADRVFFAEEFHPQEEAKKNEVERVRREQEAKKKQENAIALEKSKESKTGVEWQLEEDHCLSQAVKKFPVGKESGAEV